MPWFSYETTKLLEYKIILDAFNTTDHITYSLRESNMIKAN